MAKYERQYPAALATVLVLLIGTAEALTVLAARGATPTRAGKHVPIVGRYGVLRWLWTGAMPSVAERLSLAGTALHGLWATTVTRGGRLGCIMT